MSNATVSAPTATLTAKPVGRAGVAALTAIREAKAAIAEANIRKTAAEAVLANILGDATTGTFMGVPVLRVVASHNSSIDQKLLREGFPEAFEATYRKTPYTFIKAL